VYIIYLHHAAGDPLFLLANGEVLLAAALLVSGELFWVKFEYIEDREEESMHIQGRKARPSWAR